MSFVSGQITSGPGIMGSDGHPRCFKTGRGVPFGFLVARSHHHLITMVPLAVLGSAIAGDRRQYTYVREMIGRKSGFCEIAVMFAVSMPISTFALGFANYLQAIPYPGSM